MKNVIVCVLSAIQYSLEGKTPNNYSFLGNTYNGIQTNVAPVSCLIDCWSNSGDTVEIECLCSPECEKAIPGEDFDTFLYFDRQIQEFADKKGINVICNPVPYDFNKPELSLSTIITRLDAGSRIHIDLTGGGRDAAALLALAAQIFKMQTGQFEMGDILYANNGNKTITLQNSTFDLVGLTNAANAFTEYAKADQLVAFFGAHAHSVEVDELCGDLRCFSDALALCQVDDIQKLVVNVQKSLKKVRSTIGSYVKQYDEAQARLDELKYDSEICTPDEADQLKNFVAAPRYEPAEMLFSTLIPGIQDSFVKEVNTAGECVFETIRWCVQHHLVQQALCLFVEHISSCMIELGYFSEKPEIGMLTKLHRKQLRRSLMKTYDLPAKMRSELECFAPNWRYRTTDYFIENEQYRTKLEAIVPWILFITKKRNIVAHSDFNFSSKDKKVYEKLGKKTLDPLSLEETESEILEALDIIAGTNPQWTELSSYKPSRLRGFKSSEHIIQHDIFLKVPWNELDKCELLSWEKGSLVEFEVNESKSGFKTPINIILKAEAPSKKEVKNKKPFIPWDKAKDLLLERASIQGKTSISINVDYNSWAEKKGETLITNNTMGTKGNLAKIFAQKFPEVFEAEDAILRILTAD